MATVRMRHLLAPVIVSLLLLMANSLDLNEPAAEWMENEEPYQQQAVAQQPAVGKPTPTNPARPNGAAGQPSAEQLKKLQAIYVKVLKLFEVLKLCDTPSFDISRTSIPEKWSDQAKAMMVLNKIGKQNLIKKADLSRFKRIMNNCNQIDALVRKREEEALSLESQMSGVTSEDLEQFRRQQEENPLDDLRARFATASSATVAKKPSRLPPWMSSSRSTTLAPSQSLNSEFVIRTAEGSRKPASESGPTLIKFL